MSGSEYIQLGIILAAVGAVLVTAVPVVVHFLIKRNMD